MHILLTGGSGFIGKNIVEQLGSIYTILAPSHAELELTDTDTVKNYLETHPVDIVIHAANRGGTRVQKDQTGVAVENLRIFYNLIEAKSYYKRLIVLGSGAEYNKRLSLHQVSENFFGTSIPVDEYGMYKYVSAKFAEHVDYITYLRLFAVFGKYEDYRIRFISNAICKALLGLPITIRQNVVFDYLYINDFISILKNAIDNPAGERIYNVGSGEPIDLYTIAKKIIHILKKDVPIIITEDGLGNEYSPDISRLKKIYPNGKVMAFDEALEELIEYYKSTISTLDKREFYTDL